MMELLLHNQADPELEGAYLPPLHSAIEFDDIEAIQLLLIYKANVNRRITTPDHPLSGTTPLAMAIISKRAEIAALLVENGAILGYDVQHFVEKCSALNYSDCIELVQRLILSPMEKKLEEINLQQFEQLKQLRRSGSAGALPIPNFPFPLFVTAIQAGNPSLAISLIRAGANVNSNIYLVEDSNQEPMISKPTHFAIASGHSGVLTALIEHGLDVNALSDKGDAFLHIAIRFGKPNLAKILIERGQADIELQTKQGTALYVAVCYKQAALAEYLVVERKADIEARCEDNRTPIIGAVSRSILLLIWYSK